MSAPGTSSFPVRVLDTTRYRPSLGFPSGGIFVYFLRASVNEVRPYVPNLAPGTIVAFVAVDVTNEVHVYAKQKGKINGSPIFTIQLVNKGDTLILSAGATSWHIIQTPIEVS